MEDVEYTMSRIHLSDVEQELVKYGRLLADKVERLRGEPAADRRWFPADQPWPMDLDGNPVDGVTGTLLMLSGQLEDKRGPLRFLSDEDLTRLNEGSASVGKDGHDLPEVHIRHGEQPTTVLSIDRKYSDLVTGHEIGETEYSLLPQSERRRYEPSPTLALRQLWRVSQTNMNEARPEMYAWMALGGKAMSESARNQDRKNAIVRMVRENNWICPIEGYPKQKVGEWKMSPSRITIPEEWLTLGDDQLLGRVMNELAHSTAWDDALNRVPWSRSNYSENARQELVAELSAAVTAKRLGLDRGVKVFDSAKWWPCEWGEGWLLDLRPSNKFYEQGSAEYLRKTLVESLYASEYIEGRANAYLLAHKAEGIEGGIAAGEKADLATGDTVARGDAGESLSQATSTNQRVERMSTAWASPVYWKERYPRLMDSQAIMMADKARLCAGELLASSHQIDLLPDLAHPSKDTFARVSVDGRPTFIYMWADEQRGTYGMNYNDGMSLSEVDAVSKAYDAHLASRLAESGQTQAEEQGASQLERMRDYGLSFERIDDAVAFCDWLTEWRAERSAERAREQQKEQAATRETALNAIKDAMAKNVAAAVWTGVDVSDDEEVYYEPIREEDCVAEYGRAITAKLAEGKVDEAMSLAKSWEKGQAMDLGKVSAALPIGAVLSNDGGHVLMARGNEQRVDYVLCRKWEKSDVLSEVYGKGLYGLASKDVRAAVKRAMLDDERFILREGRPLRTADGALLVIRFDPKTDEMVVGEGLSGRPGQMVCERLRMGYDYDRPYWKNYESAQGEFLKRDGRSWLPGEMQQETVEVERVRVRGR